MGTTYTCHTDKKTFIQQELLEGFDPNVTVLDHAVRGNQVWIAIDVPDEGKYLSLYHIRKDDKRFGYKGMDALDHPNYYDCPQKLVSMVENETHYQKSERFNKWNQIRQNQLKTKKSDLVGKTLTIKTLRGEVESRWKIMAKRKRTYYAECIEYNQNPDVTSNIEVGKIFRINPLLGHPLGEIR